MRKYGLIGFPLGHSFSKQYFSGKFLKENIKDCCYENFPIEKIDLFADLISSDPDLAGLNVTIPYKTEILRFIDFFDPEIKEIGSVNVLKIKRTGDKASVFGFNSDVVGIHESIVPFLGKDISNALILGTGGSSCAVSYVLKKLGINAYLVSRKGSSGVLTYRDLNPDLIKKCRLIVNTTPLGMFPDTDKRPDIDFDSLDKNHILFDLVYNPEITAFLAEGEKRGCRIITGLKMLHSQAERSWEIWNDNSLDSNCIPPEVFFSR